MEEEEKEIRYDPNVWKSFDFIYPAGKTAKLVFIIYNLIFIIIFIIIIINIILIC